MNILFFKYRIGILLVIFFLIAFIIRIYALGSVPGGFHEDEAHIGYNAYSLLKTLHDKNGVFLPLAIDQFGDFRPSGLHFITIPSIAIFGLNEFATRLPVAIFGALSVVVFYLLTFEIFRKKSIALIASAMMVINPWHFIASRSTSESIVALFFVMLGIYLLLLFIRKNKSSTSSHDILDSGKAQSFQKVLDKEKKQLVNTIVLFIFSIASLLLSFQFYHAARYFVPFIVLFILLCVFLDKSLTSRTRLTITIGTVVILSCLFLLFKLGGGSGRVQEISIFTHPAVSIEFWKQKSEDKGYPPLLVQFLHNKPVVYGYDALVNYGKHFTPDFLFFKGGLPPRYMIPWNGNYYPIDAVGIIVGFSILLVMLIERRNKDWFYLLPFVWLIAGPIPAAFTFEDIPHFQRAIMMLPALLIFAAYGVYILLTNGKSKIYSFGVSFILILVLGYQVVLFMHDYFHHALVHDAKYRNEGQKELVLSLNEYKNQGRNIIMTRGGANNIIFYLFHNKMDPNAYQKLGSPRESNGLIFDHALYLAQDCPSYSAIDQVNMGQLNTVYVDLGYCLPRTETRLIKEIKRPDETIAFRILEIKPETITKFLEKSR